ncbi:MAG: biopolymer transporter ExbD [Planctomycetota bacterium]
MRIGLPESARRTTASLPLTSMIDVVFLLLIFFMLTATFAMDEERLDSALASEGQGAVSSEELLPQILEVSGGPEGDVFVIGGRRPQSQAELVGVLKQLPKGPGVIIRVADTASIGAIASAKQAVADAGFGRRTYVPATPD